MTVGVSAAALRSYGHPFLLDFLRFVKSPPKVISKLGQGESLSSGSRCCPDNTLIIFDWDDTLFCTSALKIGENNMAVADLSALQEHVLSLLSLAKCLGKVAIVTSSSRGWVERSAKKWLPALLPVLEEIPIIYARERYGSTFPMNSMQWKLQSFRELHESLALTLGNIVVIGDSRDEMRAAKLFGEMNPGILVKRAEFSARSSLPGLLQKLQLMGVGLRTLVEARKSKKLEINLVRAPDSLPL
mmetsp:Transcript_64725/g.141022  ORF Transcript_64725/g.141022 Transcript_64725/m.141022 type:complete len:244 (+) Transcript_64725:41-772(+)|eukprot:CAMPEP_0170591594 /NCGR_PEP_ID=MMETSP0224-20130122/12484_1 /TAXON_ID=285029 /ORGANISM="Togula jolla, Strain CCCM 725" /LENGTH=243 /DNA_ID=CAMNT_0010915463 /DNA_START=40 /DNA_END=771 /DNA_ORIENTATION=+